MFIDSVTRLPEDVYRDLSIARRIIERSSATSARTPRVNTGMPGRPSYEISKDQLQSLIDLRFTVPQISELLHVSKMTIERRLAEYVISARSFTTITDLYQLQFSHKAPRFHLLSLFLLFVFRHCPIPEIYNWKLNTPSNWNIPNFGGGVSTLQRPQLYLPQLAS